jgi:hypothetical protein
MYAAMLKRSPDVIRLQINVQGQRTYTREFGSGRAITITPYECYEEGEYSMQGQWIANCNYEYSAIEKAQEIARYLVNELECPKERIKIRKK